MGLGDATALRNVVALDFSRQHSNLMLKRLDFSPEALNLLLSFGNLNHEVFFILVFFFLVFCPLLLEQFYLLLGVDQLRFEAAEILIQGIMVRVLVAGS